MRVTFRAAATVRVHWLQPRALICLVRPRLATTLVLLGTLGLVSGCARSGVEHSFARPSGSPYGGGREDTRKGVIPAPLNLADEPRLPKGGGVYKLGSPYRIANRWYVPADDPKYDRTGVASWYGPDFHGRKTANGEIYDMNAMSAAHPTLPLPSYATVTSLKTGRTILVRVNDRGPYAAGRIMDLSKRAAEVLGIAGEGVSEVRVKYAGRAPLNGDDSAERRFLMAQPWAKPQLATSRYFYRMSLGH